MSNISCLTATLAPMADKKKTINGKGIDCRECHNPHVDVNRVKGGAAEAKTEAAK